MYICKMKANGEKKIISKYEMKCVIMKICESCNEKMKAAKTEKAEAWLIMNMKWENLSNEEEIKNINMKWYVENI